MSISTQPNEMLNIILNQTGIPLPQRIRLRAVSPRFNATLLDGLQQERSLVIRVVNRGDLNNGQSKIQPNDLLLKESHFTKKKAIDFIRRLFPNVTELTIISDYLAAWRNTNELLRLYGDTLTSLKVDGYLTEPSSHDVFRNLGDAINSISTLSSLYLTREYFSCHLLLHLAPTLSRLERFTFEAPIYQNQATLIAASLSSRCTHLRLDFNYYSVKTFPFHEAAINLTHLYLEYDSDSALQFALQLPRLTTLILRDMNGPDLGALLPKIRPRSPVTQITFIGVFYYRPLERPASKGLTFPSIKRLTLQIVYNTYIRFKAMDYLSTLATWFPNLTSCSLHTPEDYREGILAIQEGALPFTVELLDNFEPTFE